MRCERTSSPGAAALEAATKTQNNETCADFTLSVTRKGGRRVLTRHPLSHKGGWHGSQSCSLHYWA